MISHKWSPIEHLPPEPQGLASSDLRALAYVWVEQRSILAQTEQMREFNERLQRQWAIETGIIERIYSLDRGITQVLIEQGIDASLSHEST